jgi:hypothetical protein
MKTPLLLLLCALVSTINTHAANIAFLSFHSSETTPSANAVTAGFINQAPDAGYTQLLTANGHTVTRFVTADNFNVSQLASFDLVIISRSVASGHYQATNETAAWNGLAVPTIILGAYINRGGSTAGNVRLGLMGGSTIPDTDGPIRLRVNAPSHPLFAGVALDNRDVMVNTYATSGTNGGTVIASNGVVQRGISVVTGAPAGGGIVLATVASDLNAAGGMVIGEWLAGSVLSTAGRGAGATNDILGGHRLVLLTGSRELGPSPTAPSDIAGIYDLSPDGAQLLLNAVNYMTSPRISIRTVNTVNNDTPGAGETSLLQALSDLQDGDYVRFAIPGAGPHTIVTPLGGYPLITNNGVIIDGYTQPGSVPNSNPILGGNNAQIKIVLDSTGTDSAGTPPLLQRRSTRLPYSGYGDSENAMIGILEADNVNIRGLSFLGRYSAGSDEDPGIYGVALVKGATNAHINGCWFGLPPGGTTMLDVKQPAAGVAGFRFNTGVVGPDQFIYSGGLVGGTDGDGFNDRAEFNVAVGCRIAYALELPAAKIAGNYVNVFPNGTNFANIDDLYLQQVAIAGEGTVEFLENGRFAHHSVFGTDGDGVSDSDERNIVAHTVYDVNLEIYTAGTNIVVAGNYFGVGVDGVTPSPVSTNAAPIFERFIALPGTASARIGSNGDGVSDDLEGNRIVNGRGTQLVPLNPSVPVVQRNNRLENCTYTSLVNDGSLVAPVMNAISNNIVSGTLTAPSGEYTTAFIDLYLVDPIALASTNTWPVPLVHPFRRIAAIADNGPGDLDPIANQFAIDISTNGIADGAFLGAAVTYSKEPAASNVGQAVTGPMSAPLARRPSLSIRINPGTSMVELSWLAPDNAFVVQQNTGFDPVGWIEFYPHTYTAGRNTTEVPLDTFPSVKYFYRLISQ